MAMPTFNFPKTEPGKRPVMLLTGASRGIGHATVMQFAMAGWRILSCSRQAFSEKCPWPSGADDHVQIDLADPVDAERGIAEIRRRLEKEGGKLHALVNNAGISPKGRAGRGSARRTPRSTTGTASSRSISSRRSCWRAGSSPS